MSRTAYCVRADGGTYADAFKAGEYAAIGWMPDRDLSDIPEGNTAALGAAYDSTYTNEGGSHPRGHDLGQIGQFLWDIKPGDAVVTPMHPSEQRVFVGIVNAGYYYEATPDDCPYPHRKRVEWLTEPVLKSYFSVPIRQVLRVPRTVFKIRPPDELLKAVGVEPLTPKPAERVEKNMSTLVLERLLELDPDEFEILVTELLTVLGFEAEKTGKTGDGGVDVEGTLDVYGFASMDLKVQVKRYKLGSKIGPKTIKEFHASVPEKAQGAFVTTSGYTKKAREAAEREGFKRIGLIDGRQLVDILTEEYDRLPIEMRERLGLRRGLMPD